MDSYEYHKANIEECKSIIANLNPQYAEAQDHDRRMNAMEDDIAEIKKILLSLKRKGD